MLPEQQRKAFGEFYDTVRKIRSSIPRPRSCFIWRPPWRWGVHPGITAEEIGAVQGVVMAVSVGRVNAQLREVERRMRRGGSDA